MPLNVSDAWDIGRWQKKLAVYLPVFWRVNVFVYYVSVFVHTCHACICECVYTCKGQSLTSDFLNTVLLTFWDRATFWNSPIWLEQVAIKLQGASCFHLPRAGIIDMCCHARLPHVGVPGIKFRSQCFCGKHFTNTAIFLDCPQLLHTNTFKWR